MKFKIITIILFSFTFIIQHNIHAQANYDESKVPDFKLPEILISESGTNINDVERWENLRRKEILKLFEEEVYGKIPTKNIDISFRIVKQDPDALCGKAIKKEVLATFGNGSRSIDMNLLFFCQSK